MPLFTGVLAALAALADRLRGDDAERGDVPGWVMITVMTAALVLAILIPFREAKSPRSPTPWRPSPPVAEEGPLCPLPTSLQGPAASFRAVRGREVLPPAEGSSAERGSALVEFTFIAIVVFVPLVYIVAGLSAVQRGVFASTAAAREAGRAMGTAPDPVTGAARAEAAARLAVTDQSIEATDVRVAYAPAGAGCDAAGGYAPTLTRGRSSPCA
ncbi:hypothetical protein [Geodermatophilus sp. URMC 60]